MEVVPLDSALKVIVAGFRSDGVEGVLSSPDVKWLAARDGKRSVVL
jgi:hypothetical protein